MPTIYQQDGFRFYFTSHDADEPAHVHVDRGGASAKVWLTPPEIARNMGFSAKELAEIVRAVRDQRGRFMREWDGFFGTWR